MNHWCCVTSLKQNFPFPVTIQRTQLLFVIEHEEFVDNSPDSSAVSQTSWRLCHIPALLECLIRQQLLHEACPIPADDRLPLMDKRSGLVAALRKVKIPEITNQATGEELIVPESLVERYSNRQNSTARTKAQDRSQRKRGHDQSQEFRGKRSNTGLLSLT